MKNRESRLHSSSSGDCVRRNGESSSWTAAAATNCDISYPPEHLTLISNSTSLTSGSSELLCGSTTCAPGTTTASCSNRRSAAVVDCAPTASSDHSSLSFYSNSVYASSGSSKREQDLADYKSSKYRDPDLVSFLRRRLLIMRLKERVMILLIAGCCVLCVLFVIQSRISDDVVWEYPKKYK